APARSASQAARKPPEYLASRDPLRPEGSVREGKMAEAYIVAAARTAGGRKGGRLAGVHPVDLAAISLDAVAARSGIDSAAIDDVIMGCVTQAGEQSLHVGRNAVLASKLPESVPAVTIDRQCGSSQQAIQF